MWSSFFFPHFSYFCLFTRASDLVNLVDLVEGEVIKRKVLKVVSHLTLADVRGSSFSHGCVCGFFRDPHCWGESWYSRAMGSCLLRLVPSSLQPLTSASSCGGKICFKAFSCIKDVCFQGFVLS